MGRGKRSSQHDADRDRGEDTILWTSRGEDEPLAPTILRGWRIQLTVGAPPPAIQSCLPTVNIRDRGSIVRRFARRNQVSVSGPEFQKADPGFTSSLLEVPHLSCLIAKATPEQGSSVAGRGVKRLVVAVWKDGCPMDL